LENFSVNPGVYTGTRKSTRGDTSNLGRPHSEARANTGVLAIKKEKKKIVLALFVILTSQGGKGEDLGPGDHRKMSKGIKIPLNGG